LDRSLSTIIDEIAEDDEVIRQDIRNAESNPSDPDSWAKLADRLSQKGYYEQSLECYRRALELNPNNISLWYNRGLALSNIGNYDEAILCFDEAIKINPNIVYAWNSKGHAFNSQGKFREAIKAYDRVIELDPKNVNARYNRGLTLSNIGSFDEAIQSFDKVLEIDEKNVGALNAKGLALEGLGRFEEAVQSYDKVLEIDEKNTDALYNKSNAHRVLGRYHEAEGKSDLSQNSYRKAIGELEKIIGLDSTNVRALELLRELFSNYIFEYNRALEVDTKLLSNESTALRKSKFAEDLIKVGKNGKGRQLAFEAKHDIPPEQIKRQSCVRLLILSSYFLDGNSLKGNEELFDFLKFYEKLENLKVEEKEWNFNGLIKVINSQSINSTSKQILTDIIDLLRGKGNREKILSKLLSKVSDSGVQIGHKAYTKIKIIVPIVFVGALVAVALAFYFIEMANAEPCGVPDQKLEAYNMGVPADIVVNDNVIYVAHSNQPAISAIDCNNEEIIDKIPTPGFVTSLSLDKKTNTLYADTNGAGANGTIVLTIDGGRFGVDTLREKFHNNWIKKVIPFPEYNENNNILKINKTNNGNTQNASDFDGNEEHYLLGDNQSTIYAVEDKGISYPIPLKLMSNQDANMPVPRDIAFDSEKNMVYLATNYDNRTASISVINASNHNYDLLKTIRGPIRSIDSIAFDNKTNKIYITDPDRQIVSVIESSNNTIVKNIPVGKVPRDIFVDDINGVIYVANTGSNAVSVINSTSNEVVKIIHLPESSGVLASVSADPETKMVYIGLSRDGLLGLIQMINSTNPKWSNYIQVGPTPSDMVFNSNTSKIYLAKTANESVSVIDTNNNDTKDIYLRGERPSKLAINPNSSKIYVANLNSKNISVIDGKKNELIGNLSLPFNVLDIAVNPKLNKIYAIGGDNKNLSIIDGVSDEVIKNENLSFFPSAIEVNPKTNKTYIADYDNWRLISIDGLNDNITNSKAVKLEIPPESITVDPITNKIYVSSYLREDISQGETTHRPPSAAFPHRTEVQIINGNSDTAMFSNRTLKLDPKYGEVILAADPKHGDILAVPHSYDTILSWNSEQAKRAMDFYGGNLLNVKEVPAGTDPTQVAFNINNGKKDMIYIINYRLNAIRVDELEKYETPTSNNSSLS